MLSLAPATPTMTTLPVYDWTEPAHIQEQDWDCSQESLEWMLWAYSRTPDDSWMEQSLQAGGYVTPAVGCTDASGAGLARWLNEQYSEYGYLSSNSVGVSFDQVAEEAGSHVHPVAMGGGAWYHWSGVRGVDGLGRLMLANPAPGWKGVYQTLDRDQWARLGPWNLVRLTHPQAESGGGAVAPTQLPAGIDVSSHQGYVDWAAVRAAGAAFSFTKATGGAWYQNPTLGANWQSMAAAGLQRGAYHFAFETSGQPFPGPGPEAEAAYFLAAVLPLGLSRTDMLCLDIEQGSGHLGEWALRWLKHVEAAVGFRPLLYTGDWFAREHGFADVPELAQYGLWQAAYQSTMPPPTAPWTSIAFWQFTDKATVPGVSTPCDGNWFNGNLDQLKGYGKPGILPPEDPYAAWSGLIGTGLLDMLRADNVLPAQSRSTWLPLGQSPADVEEVYAVDGTRYTWTVSTSNQGFRYRPS